MRRVKLSVGTIHIRELSRCMSRSVGRFDYYLQLFRMCDLERLTEPQIGRCGEAHCVTVQTTEGQFLTFPVSHYSVMKLRGRVEILMVVQ